MLTFEEIREVPPFWYSQEIFYVLHSIEEFLKNRTHQEIEYALNWFYLAKNDYETNYHDYKNRYIFKEIHDLPPLDRLQEYELLSILVDNQWYSINNDENTSEKWQEHELFAVLAYQYCNDFAHYYKERHKHYYDYMFCAFATLRLADKAVFINTIEKQVCSDYFQAEVSKIAKKARSENARKAGLNKRSPYEKMGTIHTVNEIIDEKQDLLQQRGGKAALCRMILDLIAEREIPAPDTPTQKTVEKWIADYIKQKSTR